MVDLHSLPEELLTLILEELDMLDVSSCAQVCHRFRQIIQSSMRIRYKIELLLSDMVDGRLHDLSTAEKLDKLRVHQEGWRDMNLTYTWPVECAEASWAYSSGMLAQISENGSLSIYQTPSRIREIPEQPPSVRVGFAEFSVFMFEVDYEQDLVILVEAVQVNTGDIYPRQLSKNAQPHRDAAVPRLSAPQFPDDCVCSLYVHKDLIGWLVVDFDEEISSLQVWNWRTGVLVWHLFSQSPRPYATSFVFLDSRHVMCAHLDRLVVYGFDPHWQSEVCGTLDKFEFAMEFPVLAEGARTLRAMVFAQNNSAVRPHPSLRVPFHTLDTHTLLMVMMVIGRPPPHQNECATFVIFLPASTVSSYLQRAGNHATAYPWTEWGPKNTRAIEVISQHVDWFSDVRGSKGMVAYMEDPAMKVLTVDLYEFNQRAIHRDWKRLSEDERTRTTAFQMKSSIIEAPEYFRDALDTSLPYRRSRTRITTMFTGLEAMEHDLLMDALLIEDGVMVFSSDTHCQFYTF
ncbi:uncharacterized protein LAESUDRAFT_763877 [Laetiporus sulphureus 93-53]|uniref:F-box domain-containing protein n=1 Tax=Laetiporus sulphureus 93-53 TaxID=1314785 RepID=A0A165BLR5_9APHY|nr:uncharacterized protein LAESUDRAFT_763877 [Laetiporus sulphureus 93-53]KZT01282.1 hypothetical protein LAESUDRAFT_763877 [Laetiporus sulphureus 93-53]